MRIHTAALVLLALTLTAGPGAPAQTAWKDTFAIEKGDLRATGRNAHFILEPGYQHVLEGAGAERLVITVLDETPAVDGVETRVVEERETKGGTLKLVKHGVRVER